MAQETKTISDNKQDYHFDSMDCRPLTENSPIEYKPMRALVIARLTAHIQMKEQWLAFGGSLEAWEKFKTNLEELLKTLPENGWP